MARALEVELRGQLGEIMVPLGLLSGLSVCGVSHCLHIKKIAGENSVNVYLSYIGLIVLTLCSLILYLENFESHLFIGVLLLFLFSSLNSVIVQYSYYQGREKVFFWSRESFAIINLMLTVLLLVVEPNLDIVIAFQFIAALFALLVSCGILIEGKVARLRKNLQLLPNKLRAFIKQKEKHSEILDRQFVTYFLSSFLAVFAATADRLIIVAQGNSSLVGLYLVMGTILYVGFSLTDALMPNIFRKLSSIGLSQQNDGIRLYLIAWGVINIPVSLVLYCWMPVYFNKIVGKSYVWDEELALLILCIGALRSLQKIFEESLRAKARTIYSMAANSLLLLYCILLYLAEIVAIYSFNFQGMLVGFLIVYSMGLLLSIIFVIKNASR